MGLEYLLCFEMDKHKSVLGVGFVSEASTCILDSSYSFLVGGGP